MSGGNAAFSSAGCSAGALQAASKCGTAASKQKRITKARSKRCRLNRRVLLNTNGECGVMVTMERDSLLDLCLAAMVCCLKAARRRDKPFRRTASFAHARALQ